jgi:hypothetical protein
MICDRTTQKIDKRRIGKKNTAIAVKVVNLAQFLLAGGGGVGKFYTPRAERYFALCQCEDDR